MSLLQAVVNDDLEKVKQLLKDGTNVDDVDEDYEMTALIMASGVPNIEYVQLLIESGADVNYQSERGLTPLTGACAKGLRDGGGTLEIVTYLCEHGADINKAKTNGKTPLIIASLNGKEDVVKYLCEKGADVNSIDGQNVTAFTWAINEGHIGCAKILQRHKADINRQHDKGYTALIMAVEENKAEAVEALLKMGIDTSLVNSDGHTALTFAVDRITKYHDMKKEVLDRFCEMGTKIVNEANGTGDTALVLACREGVTWLVKDLITAGARPNLADSNGNTPLIAAVQCSGHTDVNKLIQYLYQNGADIRLKNNAGKTALDIAKEEPQATQYNGPQTIDLLEAMEIAKVVSSGELFIKSEYAEMWYTFYKNISKHQKVKPLFFLRPVLNEFHRIDFINLMKSLGEISGWKSHGRMYANFAAFFVTPENNVVVMFIANMNIRLIMVKTYVIGESGKRALDFGLQFNIQVQLKSVVAKDYLLCFCPCIDSLQALKEEEDQIKENEMEEGFCDIMGVETLKIFQIDDLILSDPCTGRLSVADALCPVHSCSLSGEDIAKWVTAPIVAKSTADQSQMNFIEKYLRAVAKLFTDDDMLIKIGLELNLDFEEMEAIRLKHHYSVELCACKMLIEWKRRSQLRDLPVVEEKIRDAFIACKLGGIYDEIRKYESKENTSYA